MDKKKRRLGKSYDNRYKCRKTSLVTPNIRCVAPASSPSPPPPSSPSPVTDGPTDGPTNRPSYRDALTHLKSGEEEVRIWRNGEGEGER